MRLPVTGRTGRRARLFLAGAALLAAAAAALYTPPLVLLAIGAVALVLLWERAALDHDLRALTRAIVADDPDAKLVVTEGPWGELSHALNRLRQQRRAEQQIAAMLPALPAGRAARLADAGLPAEGLLCEVAVLAIGRADGPGDRLAQLRESAEAALRQARLHDALLARADDCVLLIFGAMGQQSLAATLRAAQQAAHAIAGAVPAGGHPRLALTAGVARAVILPGLGYSVIGPPVEQAHALQRQAPAATLLCTEEAYLGLRRLGVVPAMPPAPPRPAPQHRSADTPPHRPTYAVTL